MASKKNYDKSRRYMPVWEGQYVWTKKDPAGT